MIGVLVLAVASLGADSTGAAQARSFREILDRAGASVQDYTAGSQRWSPRSSNYRRFETEARIVRQQPI